MPYARLKPISARKGTTVKTYIFGGVRFLAERGWYEVSDDLADRLRELHQEHGDEDSPYLFDVVESKGDTDRVVEREKQAIIQARNSLRRATGNKTTQPLPVNNAGGIEDLIKRQGGDVTTVDLEQNIHGTQPVTPYAGDGPYSEGSDLAASNENRPEGEEEEGRNTDIGRTGEGPRTRHKKHGR